MMSLEEARGLLIGAEADADVVEAADALVERLGRWALLLNLARGAIRTDLRKGLAVGDAVARATDRFTRHGLTAVSRDDEGQRNRSAASCIDASIEALAEDAADAAALLETLGVFAEDASIPVDLVLRLWDAE
ncbi:MAG: hypothetical protein AAFS03_11335, partial [Pseudomonadota bacterium]